MRTRGTITSWTQAAAATVVVGVGSLAGGAWAKSSTAPESFGRGDRVDVAERPVSVSASVDRTELTTVQSATLTVVVASPPSRTVELSPSPIAGQPLGDFTVAWVRRDPPGLDGDTVIHRWFIGLEPFLPGVARVPAISAVTSDPENPDGIPTLNRTSAASDGPTTDPIEIQVVSVLDEQTGFTPGQIREPLDPLPPPGTPHTTGWLAPAIGAAAAIGLGAIGLIASRPTAAGRVRRAFHPLHRRADSLASVGRADSPRSASERAEQAVRLVREAAGLAIGPDALALTSGELVSALGEHCPALPADLARNISALLAWNDERVFAARNVEPPPMPDLAAAVRAMESALLATIRAASTERRSDR